MSNPSLEDITSLAKRRGFIFQGSEVYGGLSGTWDYGPLGVQLKRNLENQWWKTFVEERDDMFGVDAAILMNPSVWRASGHVDTFTDPLVECSNCKSRFRADHTNLEKCENCGQEGTIGAAREFNMMFKTHVGPVQDDESISYLRPETAQGIFTNYKSIVDSIYPDLPFGVAQIGKAFRNEISPRDFVFRSREFSQMEVEYFIPEQGWEEHFDKWREDIKSFLASVGVDMSRVEELEVPEDDLAHYSKRTIDFEFAYPHGKDELLGLAYRTDFDLKNIETASGKKMAYRPKDGSEPFIPHVIEPSFGVERLVMAVLISAYTVDEQEGEPRAYLKLPDHIAPVKMCVSPLVRNKEEIVGKASEVYEMLQQKYGAVMWDDNGNIGKRYRRQDEIGTPKCITIDFDTLEDGTVTVRDRDTLEQVRVKPEDI
jgi:glycyl-tRNA synthetase